MGKIISLPKIHKGVEEAGNLDLKNFDRDVHDGLIFDIRIGVPNVSAILTQCALRDAPKNPLRRAESFDNSYTVCIQRRPEKSTSACRKFRQLLTCWDAKDI